MKLMVEPAPKLMSFDEYLDQEAQATERSEFYMGRVYAMSGGSISHARICSNLGTILGAKLRGSGCESFGSGVAFSPDASIFGTYPDAMIVCGEPKIHSRGTDTIQNLIVIFEVLSPSTEAYDRGKKFDLCAKAESLKEYILISQDEARAESYTRQPEGIWLRRLFVGMDAVLRVESVGLDLPLVDVYERVILQGGLHQEIPPSELT